MKKINYLLVLFLLFPLSLLAQQASISGKVIDITDGSALPGVSVQIKGTTTGGVTDAGGKFQLTIPGPNAIIQVSYLSYETREITVKDIKRGTIALKPSSKGLEEVVVVGYGVQKRATVTGSIATLQNKEIITTKNESVINMLTGKIPGIRIVQTTAEPGSYANTLNIRGFQTPPAIVIDGIIGGDQSTLGRMDPNEIESISVLKDGAAAIYGIRAAGGAILITTKKGSKNGQVNINYSVNDAIQTFLGMPQGVGAVDYMLLTNEKAKRDFQNNFVSNVTPVYSYADILPWLNGTNKSADWIDLVFRKTADQVQHNLNIDGGNDKINYFFNFGYQKQDGVFKTGDLNYNKYNFRSNVTINIVKGLKAQVLTSGWMDQKNQPYTDEWTVYKYTWNQIPINMVYANNNPLYPNVMPDNQNPAVATDDNEVGFKTAKNKDFNSQLNLTYDIPDVPGLSAKALFNIDYGVYDYNQVKSSFNLYTYSAADSTYIPSPVNSPSGITRQYTTHTNTNGQLTLNYAHTFFQDHHVSALVTYEQSHESVDNFNAYRDTNIPIDYLFGGLANLDQSGSQLTDLGSLNDHANRSYIGRLDYDFKGKYLVEGIFRRDGSSLYQPGTSYQWGNFPGASVGWVITKEDFFRKLISPNILSNLKIRASYGQLGDEGAAQYAYVTGYTYPVNSYIFGTTPVNGSAPKLGVPGLTWPVSTVKNIGLDFGLFNGKVDGTIEVFRNDRTGLETYPTVALPGTVGAPVPPINYNSDRVQGADLSLSYRNTFGQLGVNLTGNISSTRLKDMTQLTGGYGNEFQQWQSAQSNRYQNIWWGPTYAGQFTTYKQIYNYGVNTGGGNNNVVPGDYYYQDTNHDGVIDGKDNTPIATSDIPLYNYGLTIGLSYKGFDMTAVLQGAAGVYVQYGEQFASPLLYGRSALTRFLDSWHTVDPSANVFDPNTQWVPGFYPAMGSPDAQGTKAIQNASYLRVKSLEIGYSISPLALKHIGVKKLRVYVSSYNLLTITGLKNYDPEHQGVNADNSNFSTAFAGYTYPENRTFNLGANVSF